MLERDQRLGGRLKDIHQVPHFEEMGHLLEFLVPQVEAGSTDIHHGVTATAEAIIAANPDDVIIASGASPFAPDVPGDGSVPVITSDNHIDLSGIAGRKVVIVDEDGYYWTAALTEAAIAAGARPYVVARVFEVCRELPMVSRIQYHRQLDSNGGRAIANSFVAAINNGSVEVRHYQTGRRTDIGDVAAVVWAGAAVPNAELSTQLRASGFAKHRIHLIGDAFAPRRLAHALSEAHATARSIGSPARN